MRGPWQGAQCRAYASEPLLICSGLNASCAGAGLRRGEQRRGEELSSRDSIGHQGKGPDRSAGEHLPSVSLFRRGPAAEPGDTLTY